jgi:hypothetical protein
VGRQRVALRAWPPGPARQKRVSVIPLSLNDTEPGVLEGFR